jgi:DNA-directed RNA polymerase subunit RPC12/RpoP
MSVHTLGEAWKLGWRVRVRCLWGTADPHSHRRSIECNTTADLDMHTLVWTRGEAFPLDQLESRLRCPRCGSRRVTVLFEVPNQPKSAEGRVRY